MHLVSLNIIFYSLPKPYVVNYSMQIKWQYKSFRFRFIKKKNDDSKVLWSITQFICIKSYLENYCTFYTVQLVAIHILSHNVCTYTH